MPFRQTRNPVIKLTSREFADFVADAKAYIKQHFPQWTDFLATDLGVALIEVACGLADYLTYYQNVTANESFLSTAQFRKSLFKLAKLFGYIPKRASAAQTEILVTKTDENIEVLIPRGSQVLTRDNSVSFVTLQDLHIPPGTLTGTVEVIHGELIEDDLLGVSTGAPYQSFDLPHFPLTLFADKSSTLRVLVDGEPWQETPSFVRSLKENVYMVDIRPGKTPDEDLAVVTFGNGVLGNIPSAGAVITAHYIIGGGRAGNVGAHTLIKFGESFPGVASVTNPAPASGGEDAESDDEIRENAPLHVYTRRRLVTKPDYERLIGSFREVSRVHVEHPGENVVNVYVFASGGQPPSQALKESLMAFIAEHAIVDDDVHILDPVLKQTDISARVVLMPGVSASEAVPQIEADLRQYIDKRIFSRSIHVHDIYQFFSEHELVQLASVDRMDWHGQTDVKDLIVHGGEVVVPGDIILTAVRSLA